MQNDQMGILYVVATPIGNRQDITLRAIEVLQKVDRIAAEDTRHSAPLLKHFSIQKPILSLHEFNERERFQIVLDYLISGESIALISDAGTPLISDPGFHLVRAAKAQGLEVVPVPGACAAIAALSVSGLPTDKFIFEGFLPARSETRKHRLTQLLHETRTLIFYEAPHRLLATLQSMAEIFGPERQAVVARELTKIHESVMAAPLQTLIAYYDINTDKQRGEIAIMVQGSHEAIQVTKEVIPAEVLAILIDELPLKQAALLASKITGERKNTLYQMALAMKSQSE